MSFTPEALSSFKRRFHTLSGHNLEHYKDADQRLHAYLQRIDQRSLDELYGLLSAQPARIQELLDFMTINTSEFFRNPERFLELKQRILPDLLTPHKTLRIWSAGCAGGAEIYSLVILLAKLKRLHNCHLFATDIDQRVLEQARIAEFPPEMLANVSNVDLNYFFEPCLEGRRRYRLQSQWRQKVRFESHDLLSTDYPQGFDLIVCRNVMIYFNRETKYQVYRKFNLALKDQGVLFVGGAEQLLDIQSLGYRPLSPYFLQKSC
ncbi:MAG: chemotaxis protein CheR [Candidatus Melainabacteria bacterium HGW-Melainabacteria-1]|nr:MAG: chemotaxis protein CheR [Candidatus Melainabacteria bacterium HGW-Melainabacteria-1]